MKFCENNEAGKRGLDIWLLEFVISAILAAEGVGFEPTVACATTVFKTVTIDHSVTPPERKY